MPIPTWTARNSAAATSRRRRARRRRATARAARTASGSSTAARGTCRRARRPGSTAAAADRAARTRTAPTHVAECVRASMYAGSDDVLHPRADVATRTCRSTSSGSRACAAQRRRCRGIGGRRRRRCSWVRTCRRRDRMDEPTAVVPSELTARSRLVARSRVRSRWRDLASARSVSRGSGRRTSAATCCRRRRRGTW